MDRGWWPREEGAPDGVKPVEWRLLTNRPMETFDATVELIDWNRGLQYVVDFVARLRFANEMPWWDSTRVRGTSKLPRD